MARRVAREKAVDNEQYITSKEDNYKGTIVGEGKGNGGVFFFRVRVIWMVKAKGTEGVTVRS